MLWQHWAKRLKVIMKSVPFVILNKCSANVGKMMWGLLLKLLPCQHWANSLRVLRIVHPCQCWGNTGSTVSALWWKVRPWQFWANVGEGCYEMCTLVSVMLTLLGLLLKNCCFAHVELTVSSLLWKVHSFQHWTKSVAVVMDMHPPIIGQCWAEDVRIVLKTVPC